MTLTSRPMPGPPEHRQNARPHGDGSDGWCPICHHLHARRPDGSNRLTDAECAAEYWRAKADLATIEAVLVSPSAMRRRIATWHRFAALPHALEVNA